MANLQTLKGKITSTIYPNGKGAITAADHQALLLDMVDTIDEAIGQSKSDVRADGNYPNMSVGFSANLIGRGESIASEIGFRASGGKSIEDGSARITELQGNAVVWNQLINEIYLEASNATISKTDIGYTIVPTGNAPGLRTNAANGKIIPIVGHKYAIICEKVGGSRGKYLNWGGFNASLTGAIFTATDATKTQLTIYSYNETETFTMTTPLLIDLTLMFGSGNEPITVDEFYNRMPQGIDIHAYKEGQLIFSNAYGIKSVGDNAWNGEWEMGDVSGSNGVEFDSSATWRNKGYIRILPNENYYVQSSAKVFLRARFYDADKNFIGIVSANNTDVYTNETFKTAANAHYMRFAPNVSVIAQGSQLCISLVHSGYKEGKYFPYQENIKTFDYRILDAFPDGMKPWDKVYNKNGKGYIVRGSGMVDLGSLNWYTEDTSVSNAIRFFSTKVAGSKGVLSNVVGNIVCEKYATITASNTYNQKIGVAIKTGGEISVYDPTYTDKESFKAAMQGVILYYELAEPTILEYAEPFNLDYEVWDFGTEEMLADVPSAPIKGMIRYQFNAVDEVRELRQMITALQTAIANL